MEKITFTQDEGGSVEFFVLEETRINGVNYILVTESEEDGEALILKDISAPEDREALYEVVSDGNELQAVAVMFESLLDDVVLEPEE